MLMPLWVCWSSYEKVKCKGTRVLAMNDKNNPDFKALNLGAKLTCGFEILANTKTHQDDIKQGYIQSLTNKGYFQSELKGSKKYNGLLAEAEKHLLQNLHSNGK